MLNRMSKLRVLTEEQKEYWRKRNKDTNKIKNFNIHLNLDRLPGETILTVNLNEPFSIHIDGDECTSKELHLDTYDLRVGDSIKIHKEIGTITKIETILKASNPKIHGKT